MLETFIEKARSVHGDSYSYHLVQYVNMVTKVKIECQIHGTFVQYPFHHVKGAGCKRCGIERRVIKQQIPADVIAQRKQDHLTNIAKNNELRRSARREAFITKARLEHGNRYDYSKVDYRTLQDQVTIICPDHGDFNQRPANHYRGQGCPKCVGHVSRMETKWLDSLGITDRQICHYVGGRKFVFDGFDSRTNTVYLFHGDYWHGNPIKYQPLDYHPVIGTTYGQLYRKTIEDEEFLRKAGYNVVTMWESDF